MGEFSPIHWMIVLAIILLLFGGRKIPELAKGLGEGIRNFKEGMSGASPPTTTPPPGGPPPGGHAGQKKKILPSHQSISFRGAAWDPPFCFPATLGCDFVPN